jgi:cytoskeletal protein RodZ
MRSDRIQVLALAGVILVAIIIGVISWGMIPDSQNNNNPNTSNDTPTNATLNNSYDTPDISKETSSPNETSPGSESTPTDLPDSYTGDVPTSVVKWQDSKAGSELKSDGKAEWTQLPESTVDAKIGYNRLGWDNVFYDNLFGGGDMKVEVSWAFTDGSRGDAQRNPDEIGYHGTWAPTSVTWVVTSETWNARWTLGVVHTYTYDFNAQGANTGTYGLHYRTYE